TQAAGFHSVDPRAYAQYKLTSHINVYTSAAKGFRSGGFNSPGQPTYGPESLWTYELGTKMALLDDRLSLDTAFFYSDYTDYQTFGFTLLQLPLNQNAGDARIQGIDFDFTWQPTDQWRLSFKGDYLDTRFTKINLL